MAKNIIVKRIPIGLEWTRGDVWFGYRLPIFHCECCLGIGHVNWELEAIIEGGDSIRQKRLCPICHGKGEFTPILEVPEGRGYQLWGTENYKTGRDETQYYPISPECKTAFDLAEWMANYLIINNDPLFSEQTWYDAIEENNVDIVYGLYKATNEHFDDFVRMLSG